MFDNKTPLFLPHFFFEIKIEITKNTMNIIKRLPSQLAQHVFSYDDTYSNLYRTVIIQLMYYNMFNLNTISNLNKWKPTKYSLNKKGKVTNAIKQFIKDTNKKFDINQINVFKKELPNLYTVLNKVPRGEKLFKPSYFVMFSDYRDYLSFKKYACVNHFSEFRRNEDGYHMLMLLALILNGYPYKFEVRGWPILKINAHFTEFYNNMYRDSLHNKKCNCAK